MHSERVWKEATGIQSAVYTIRGREETVQDIGLFFTGFIYNRSSLSTDILLFAGNVLKELSEPAGATIYCSRFTVVIT